MARTVLVIDDEPELGRLIDYNLTKAGYLVLTARDGEAGLAAARKHAPDLVVLDVMMPGLDGWEVCKRLRQEPSTAALPILMLTAKAEESDRVLGLELGADDYLTKPFSVRELAARVKALLRRAEATAAPAEVLKAGPLVIDAGRRSVTAAGKEVVLTTTEFNLLRALAERRGRVVSREDLISLARGHDATVVDRTVDVHVAALRRKLGKHGELIETVRGVGYRLRE
ncbi:MAG TPA: response regulator transcription factor [Planctomycetota bacterium]|nr:response regulator transcription factor [Planctomycetota bacterium]